ncbi:MAG: YggT family protein [Legionellales bacterium]|nr:YggT family protein [Legionellales bacterium]|tara:strand:+ start:24795 stop:25376 length:582 start_codon:yes stop_codon:yes gene_type:complete
MTPLHNAGLFLLQVLFDLYIFIVILRFMLPLIGADFYNPVCQFVIKFTKPLTHPLQKLIPCYKRIDFSVALLAVALEVLKVIALVLLQAGTIPNIAGIVVWSIGELLNQVLHIFFYSIIIQVILSWLRPTRYNPFLEIIYRLNSPILRPIQRLIPPIGGLDLSPIGAILLLQITTIIISQPIMAFGAQMVMSQ